VAKVVASCVFSGLRILRVGVGRHREPKSSSRESFWDGFKRNNRQAICKSEQRADGPTKGVANNPDIRLRIHLSDIGIEFPGSLIVSVFRSQCLDHASVIAAIGAGGAVADLMPRPLALLGTTTAEEQVVVLLVIRRRALTVEYGG
jgi:hypothetical protein